MVTKIQKWGNSQGLRFSKDILNRAKIMIGDKVEVAIRQGTIVIKPITKIRGKYRLKDLIAKIPKNYKTKEVKWGGAIGKEEW